MLEGTGMMRAHDCMKSLKEMEYPPQLPYDSALEWTFGSRSGLGDGAMEPLPNCLEPAGAVDWRFQTPLKTLLKQERH